MQFITPFGVAAQSALARLFAAGSDDIVGIRDQFHRIIGAFAVKGIARRIIFALVKSVVVGAQLRIKISKIDRAFRNARAVIDLGKFERIDDLQTALFVGEHAFGQSDS